LDLLLAVNHLFIASLVLGEGISVLIDFYRQFRARGIDDILLPLFIGVYHRFISEVLFAFFIVVVELSELVLLQHDHLAIFVFPTHLAVCIQKYWIFLLALKLHKMDAT
jgi:hypothetical protein